MRLLRAVLMTTLGIACCLLVAMNPAWFLAGVCLLALHVFLAAPMLILAAPGVLVRRGKALSDPRSDLARRRVAWDTLSELYLDTSFDDVDGVRAAEHLRESGYTVQELEQILHCELHPVLIGNLLSLAGEWGGFDPAWLEREVLRRPRPKRLVCVVFGL